MYFILMPCPSIDSKWFCTVQIILVQFQLFLDRSNPFWLGPNHFEQTQIIKFGPQKSNLNLTKMICIQPKLFGTDENILHPSKTIWTVQNHFGPIEGQGIIVLLNFKQIWMLVFSLFWFVFICKMLLQRI